MAKNDVLERFACRWKFCWACGICPSVQRDTTSEHKRRLEIHHICKLNRLHEDWNLSRLCSMCHGAAEGERLLDGGGEPIPMLSQAWVFWLKEIMEPRHYDFERMELQWRVGVPDAPAPIGKWYVKQFQRFRSTDHSSWRLSFRSDPQ